MKFSHLIGSALAATLFVAAAPQIASACENRSLVDVRGNGHTVAYETQGSCNTGTVKVMGRNTNTKLRVEGDRNRLEAYSFGNGTSMNEVVFNQNTNVIRFAGACRRSRQNVSTGESRLDIHVGNCQ